MSKNVNELSEKYSDSNFRESFRSFYTIRMFLVHSLIVPDYEPSEKFNTDICLNAAGEKCKTILRKKYKEIPDSTIKFAIFCEFYQDDLLFDPDNSDQNSIFQSLNTGILEGKIIFPWIYRYTLHNRFNEIINERRTYLTEEETRKLLENTPKGVFQEYDTVVGPLGALKSSSIRTLSPKTTWPLWKCSDPSCESRHNVDMTMVSAPAFKVYRYLSGQIKSLFGLPSDWSSFYQRCSGYRLHYYDDMGTDGLYRLLINSFSDQEISKIVEEIIRRDPTIRNKFNHDTKLKKLFQNSPDKISNSLTIDQSFQLILLTSDENVSVSLETLIHNKTIRIPPTEIRENCGPTVPGGWFDVNWEASQFGVRATIGNRATNIANIRLKNLIQNVYKNNEANTDLEWALQYTEGRNIAQKLDNYISPTDPREVVAKLLFNSKQNVRETYKLLRYGLFEMPSSHIDEKFIIDKILWKLGFDIRLFPKYQELFWERYYNFLGVAKSCTAYDDKDKEKIRSFAVNFFVSVEEILKLSLSFITWSLLSDHYLTTQFKFNLEKAQRNMALSLNQWNNNNGIDITYDDSGINTLYPLIQGFRILSDICKEIISHEKDYVRSQDELPHFHGATQMDLYPFVHSIFLLDMEHEECSNLLEFLEKCTYSLDVSNICDVRNRIEHDREIFPQKKEIEEMCIKLENTIKEMEAFGICPSVFYFYEGNADKYGRYIMKFRNYNERQIELHRPSQFNTCGLPNLNAPLIFIPEIHLSDSNESIRFMLEENSPYFEITQVSPVRLIESIK